MSSPPLNARSTVKEWRERANLRPGDFARSVGITRQALHAIETDASTPSVAVALRMAHVLGCHVEDLFLLPADPSFARWAGPPVPTPARVNLAFIAGDLVTVPLPGTPGFGGSADGVVEAFRPNAPVPVTLLAPLDIPRRTLVLAGCDPSLSLLASRVARRPSNPRVLWRDLPSLDALRALARREVHVAGIHLWDARTGDHNRPFVQRELAGRSAHLITLWEWEQGLVVANGNPKNITRPEDLTGGNVTLANRADGAGCRLLLDAWLDGCGLPPDERATLPGYATTHPTHLALAQSIARGEADAGPGPRAVARELGLDFVPVQRERFDLVVPEEHLDHPGVRALLSAAREQAFQAELTALGGYDLTLAGTAWPTP